MKVTVGSSYWMVIRLAVGGHCAVLFETAARVHDPDPDGVCVIITTQNYMTLDTWCFDKREDAEAFAAELLMTGDNDG